MRVLQGKVALVTGGSRGIGRAIALRLARDSASVVVDYVHAADEAQAVVDAIQSQGGTALTVQADVSDVSSIERLFAQTVERFGHLDIVVNNAGIWLYSLIADATEEAFDRLFATNARGTFFCLREAARHVGDGGRIVCISSVATRLGYPGNGIYAGTKAAIEQFCLALSKELGPHGITVKPSPPVSRRPTC